MVSVHHDKKTPVKGTHEPYAEFVRLAERADARYVILRLRGLEPDATESEADILVAPEDLTRLRQAATGAGFTAVLDPHKGAPTADRDRHVHARYDAIANRWFILEFATDLYFDRAGGHHHHWRVVGLANRVLNMAIHGDHGRIPSGPCGALAAVLHEVVNRHAKRTHRLHTALMALLAADPDRGTAIQWLDAQAEKVINDAIDAVRTDRPVSIEALHHTLVASVRRAAWREPLVLIKRLLTAQVDRVWHRRLGRPRVVVSVIGPDGVGKTTVCGLLAGGLQPPQGEIKYRYAGRTKRTGLARVPRLVLKAIVYMAERLRTRVSDAELVNLVEVRLHLMVIRMRSWFGALRGPVLFTIEVRDRGISDELALLTHPKLIARARVLLARRERERFVVFLSDDPERIVRRKDELTEVQLAEAFERYRTALPRYADLTPWVEVPIRGRDAEGVARACREQVFPRLATLVRQP